MENVALLGNLDALFFLSSFHLMGFPRLGVVGLFMEQWRSRERLERGTLSGPIVRIWEGKGKVQCNYCNKSVSWGTNGPN